MKVQLHNTRLHNLDMWMIKWKKIYEWLEGLDDPLCLNFLLTCVFSDLKDSISSSSIPIKDGMHTTVLRSPSLTAFCSVLLLHWIHVVWTKQNWSINCKSKSGTGFQCLKINRLITERWKVWANTIMWYIIYTAFIVIVLFRIWAAVWQNNEDLFLRAAHAHSKQHLNNCRRKTHHLCLMSQTQTICIGNVPAWGKMAAA